jgi:hypothetical protein
MNYTLNSVGKNTIAKFFTIIYRKITDEKVKLILIGFSLSLEMMSSQTETDAHNQGMKNRSPIHTDTYR